MTNTPKFNNQTTFYQKPRHREPVLVVLYADGFVEVFAERHVDVHIAIMPYMSNPEGEILAEEYLDYCLSQRHRDLYWPNRRRAVEQVRCITPQDLADRQWQQQMLRSSEQAGKILRGKSESEVVSCLI